MTSDKPKTKMKFETYIAKQVAKHGAKGFRTLLASDGFDKNGRHKVFPKITEIHNQPDSVRVVDASGESIKVKTA